MENKIASVVQVRLSSDAKKLYPYVYDPIGVFPDIGTRAVVPHRLKDDGTISMVIGTVEDVIERFMLDPAIEYKEVVQFLDSWRVERATDAMKEAARGEAIATRQPVPEGAAK